MISPSGPIRTRRTSVPPQPSPAGWRPPGRTGDWTASAASRAERPLFCAVTKTGRVTGEGLSDKAVTRLIKQAARDAGLPERYSGHSLRAGLAELMRQTRHKSTALLRPAVTTEKVFGGGGDLATARVRQCRRLARRYRRSARQTGPEIPGAVQDPIHPPRVGIEADHPRILIKKPGRATRLHVVALTADCCPVLDRCDPQ